MRVVNYTNLSPERLAQVERELSWQQNLQDILKWALADQSGAFAPSVVTDVVVQDEFTHDVLVSWRDGLVLVFD
ncbi:MAG: hypothetical protein ACRD9R_21830, partial [Pyrinomonadaceae bacterium]